MRVLQISDLHIVAGEGEEIYGVDSYASLSLVLEDAMTARPDLIVATGDLAERGDVESYARLRDLLLALGVPVFVLPGNHDAPRRIARELDRPPIHVTDQHDSAGWRLLFVDSRVRGEPHGRIDSEQRNALHRAIDEDGERPVLVALHHAPIAPCPSFGCQLLGASEFLEGLASRRNVRAVIAGHSHIEAHARFGGLEVFTTPSTCAEAVHAPAGECSDLVDFWASHHFEQGRHGYRLLDLDSDGSVRSEVRWVENPFSG